MKKYFMFIGMLTLFSPLLLNSQSETFHVRILDEFDFDYGNGWVAHVNSQLTVNQVQKIGSDGVTEIKYVNNYREMWEYYNTETGEKKMSPGNENIVGVFSFGPDGWENDRHWVHHYVKDPIYGSYHINYNLLWQYNPDTGFMEIIDIQNQWYKD